MTYTGEQKREYQRKWLAKRRADYLTGKSCVVCGSTENLEVDHVEPETKVANTVWSWTEERRLIELAKCQILCKTHHLEKTKMWWANKRKHGRTMYEYYGCRCEVCKDAKRKHNAQRRRIG